MTTPKQQFKAIKRALNKTFLHGGARILDSLDLMPRAFGYADEIIRIGHKGWFKDTFQDETIRGEVWELSRDDKESIFLAGYSEPDAECIALSCTRGELDAFETAEDAAHAADALAESVAQEEREYSERWQEASVCADEIERMKSDAAAVRGQWRINATHARDYGRDESYAEESRAEHAGIIAAIVAKRERIAELDMQGEF